MLTTRSLPVLIAVALALTTTPAAAQLTGQTVVIAVAGPLSGGASALGVEQKQGVELAVDERNVAGGILGAPVVLVAADDARTRARARPRRSASTTTRASWGWSAP